LNQTRANILRFITTYIGRNGYGPTVREIAAGVGTVPSNVQRHVVALARAGKIVKRWRRARSIRLPAKGTSAKDSARDLAFRERGD
jgi:SOS-response transcriptional repressor LexA